MTAKSPRGVLSSFMHRAAILAGSLLIACAGGTRVPNLTLDPVKDRFVYQGGTLALPFTSDRGTTVTVRPPTGVGLTVAPASFQNIDGSEQAIISAAQNATIGLYHVEVTGINGVGGQAKTQVLMVPVEVVAPFTLRVLDVTSARAGQVITGTVQVKNFSQFRETVVFTMQGLPQNTQVTFGPTEFDRSTFTIIAPTGTPDRIYPVTVIGTSGTLVQSVPLNIEILPPVLSPDFTLAISPGALTLFPSGTASANIVIGKNAAVTENIVLSSSTLPPNVSAVFTPPSVPGDPTRLTLTSVNASPGVPVTITVTGVANGETRTATFTLAVVAVPNFTLTPRADTVTLQNPLTTLGSVAIDIGRTGQVGPVTLVANGVPAGVNTAFTTSPATGNSSTLVFSPTGTTTPGNYTLTILGTADGISKSTQVVLKVLASLGDFTVKFALPSFDVVQGSIAALVVNLSPTGTMIGSPIAFTVTTAPPQSTAVASPATTTSTATIVNLTVGATAPIGQHGLRITATGGGLTRTDSTVVNIIPPSAPGFRLAAIPSQFQFPRGSITPFAVGVTRISGFAGTVTMSAVSPLPGNITIALTPFPSAPDVFRVEMYASPNVQPGPYTIQITGTSGALTVTINVSLIVDP